MQNFLILDVVKYWNTIRFLKFHQIYRRFWFWFYKPKFKISTRLSLRHSNNNWLKISLREQSLIDQNTFNFFNRIGNINKLGWDSQDRQKLWRYHQHYFDDLNAKESLSRTLWHKALLEKWARENPPFTGTGWESYPTSLRITNWIKWQLSGNKLSDLCFESLILQCHWLSKRIEWHILGNHLFANAKALVFAGSFFSGKDSELWLKKGLQIIFKELSEQVLIDGGHFERSPMYHSIFIEDLLDLINLFKVYPKIISKKEKNFLTQKVIKMLIWLNKMVHPDGEIPYFNDTSIKFSASPEKIFLYAKKLKIKYIKKKKKNELSNLHPSGYIKFLSKDAVAFFDVGPIGPDYQPGHAHADTLSFELSLFGRRVIVNRGVSEYEEGKFRQLERSTISHNTVIINDHNSSEVWGQFRVGRRARPKELLILKKSNSSFKIRCSHDGYTQFDRGLIHQRTWNITSKKLFIEDYIKGSFKNAFAIFHFYPLLKPFFINNNLINIILPGHKILTINIINGKAKFFKSYYALAFGKRKKCSCLKVFFTSDTTKILFEWN